MKVGSGITTRVPLPTVSKLCKELSRAGLVASHRGRHGGYALARPADQVSVAEVVEALEGPIALTECSTDVIGLCDFEARCPIRSNQQIISKAVSGALERLMLSDLVQPLQLAAIKDAQGKLVTIGPISGRMQ